MKKVLAAASTVAVASGALIAGGLAAAAPANATAMYRCPNAHVCIYVERNFVGDYQYVSGYTQYQTLYPQFVDNTGSWVNANNGTTERLIDFLPGGGLQTIQILPPNWVEGNLDNVGGTNRANAVGWAN